MNPDFFQSRSLVIFVRNIWALALHASRTQRQDQPGIDETMTKI
jgi:hypothetical protein